MPFVELPDRVRTLRNLVGGEWMPPLGGKHLDVDSPYTGQVVAHVPLSDAGDVDRAVKAAAAAAPGWRATPIKERTQKLFRFRELLFAELNALSNTAALESGKTVEEAKAGILKGIEVAEYALSLQNMSHGGVLEVSRGVSCETRREPLGVVAGIVPFNFPAMVPMWMFPIAITLGNTFVMKPSEKVPLTLTRIGELMGEAGFPPGVFSLVHGGREAAEALVEHPDIAAVAFVGSSAAARAVYERATRNGKRALCLGGAKNQLIVVPDADPDVTVKGVVDSFTGCAGQRCMAASLLLAVGDVDPLLSRIHERARSVELGRQMGAIIDRAAKERILAAIAKAEAQGAKIVVDGRKASAPAGYEGGYWMGPTVIDHARPEMECATMEIFGPVMTVVRVRTVDEALAIEAKNRYGNATSVFTTRGAVARYVAERSTSGMIGVNVGVPVPREPFSFGGTKDSRFGQGDITGQGGVEFWTTLKKITSKWELQQDNGWMS